MGLEGRVAIVTGAGRGIGESISRILAQNGARVVLVDIILDNAKKAADKITGSGGDAIGIRADVSKPEDVNDTVRTLIDKYGKVDILVNNAGVAYKTAFEELTIQEWDKVMDINLKGAFLFSQAVIKYMKEQRYGRIINISSMAGIAGSENVGCHYCASMAGLIGMTKYLSRNYAYYGITINAIAPGPIGSEMTEGFGSEEYKVLIDSMPMKKLGRPENIGDIAAFLASEEAEFITGTTIEASGGEIVVV
ncbi:MAG: SDR family NAD(P)-dependent oxidoreductase [Clostridiales bacterium]|nr:SDR family NAD(P)-dependent oxidoreductase [Clostridiales bacterium]